MLKKVMATENEAAENEKNAASEADKIIKKAKDDAEKLLSEKEKECAVYEAAEIKKAKDTAEVIVTEAVKEAQRYADGLKKQSAEKLSEAVGIVKDTLLKGYNILQSEVMAYGKIENEKNRAFGDARREQGYYRLPAAKGHGSG